MLLQALSKHGLVFHRRLFVPREHATVERANGVISDTLRAFANGSKDDWDRYPPLTEFVITNATSKLGNN